MNVFVYKDYQTGYYCYLCNKPRTSTDTVIEGKHYDCCFQCAKTITERWKK